MRQRTRHPIWAAFSGLFLGLFVGLDLLFLGAIPLNSVMLTILPVVGLVVGLVLGFMGPLRKKQPKTPAADTTDPYVAPPPQPPEPAPVVGSSDAAADEPANTPLDQYVPPPPAAPDPPE
jgi:hypothetical protein